MKTIYHLIPKSNHLAHPVDQDYTPASFDDEGFIHCTADIDTLLKIANVFFADLDEPLLCYAINTEKLVATVRWEAPSPVPNAEKQPSGIENILFPHIYGAINPSAIIEVIPFQRDSDGKWNLTEARQ